MGSTLVEAVVSAPLNCALILFCSVLWFVMWNRRLGVEEVSVSYDTAVRQRQLYRIISAQLVHANLMHILFNMASMTSVGILETALGTAAYARLLVTLLLLCMALFLGITHVAVKRFGRADWGVAPAVGFSAVIFGLMTLLMIMQPSGSVPLPIGFSVPYWLAPWVWLGITQLIVPRASFLGHASGILAGYLVGAGATAWVSDLHFWMLAANVLVLCILSLKMNPALSPRLPCITVSPEFTRIAAPPAAAGATAVGAGSRAYMDGGRLHAARRDVEVDTGVAPAGAGSLRDRAAAAVSGWWTAARSAVDRARGGGGGGGGGGGAGDADEPGDGDGGSHAPSHSLPASSSRGGGARGGGGGGGAAAPPAPPAAGGAAPV